MLHIWNREKGTTESAHIPCFLPNKEFRISGDGSLIFAFGYDEDMGGPGVHAICTQTGKDVQSRQWFSDINFDSVIVDGLKIWGIHRGLHIREQDFGNPDLPSHSSNTPPTELPFVFDGIKWWKASSPRIQDVSPEKEVFQLVGKYANPIVKQWDGRYLIAGYKSGDALILDFNQILL